jgi:hypothetical protein
MEMTKLLCPHHEGAGSPHPIITKGCISLAAAQKLIRPRARRTRARGGVAATFGPGCGWRLLRVHGQALPGKARTGRQCHPVGLRTRRDRDSPDRPQASDLCQCQWLQLPGEVATADPRPLSPSHLRAQRSERRSRSGQQRRHGDGFCAGIAGQSVFVFEALRIQPAHEPKPKCRRRKRSRRSPTPSQRRINPRAGRPRTRSAPSSRPRRRPRRRRDDRARRAGACGCGWTRMVESAAGPCRLYKVY